MMEHSDGLPGTMPVEEEQAIIIRLLEDKIAQLQTERDALMNLAKQVPVFIRSKDIKLGMGESSIDSAFNMLPEHIRKQIEGGE